MGVVPSRCDSVEFVKEQHTRRRSRRTRKYITHLLSHKSAAVRNVTQKANDQQTPTQTNKQTNKEQQQATHTACSLAPMYLFSSSGPLTDTKRTAHSRATALAMSVLPQPGGPNNSKLIQMEEINEGGVMGEVRQKGRWTDTRSTDGQ